MQPISRLNTRPHAPSPQAPGMVWLWTIAALMMCGYIDMATGYEVSVFVLYLLPVALATRLLGYHAGIVVALLATGVWAWADVYSGHTYSHAWFRYVNAFNRLACFLLMVGAIRYVRERQSVLRRRIQALTEGIHICTACTRLGDKEDYWRPLESYFTEVVGAELHHKVCPDCARRQYARAAYRAQVEQTG